MRQPARSRVLDLGDEDARICCTRFVRVSGRYRFSLREALFSSPNQ